MEWSELGDYKLPCDRGNLKLYIPIFKGLMPTPLGWITGVCVCVCVCVFCRRRKWKWKLLSCVWLFATHGIIHRILWARIWELGTTRFIISFQLHKASLREMCNLSKWVAFPFFRGSSSTQGSNSGLPHCRCILYQLSQQGKPKNAGVGSLPLLLWTFPTQEWN